MKPEDLHGNFYSAHIHVPLAFSLCLFGIVSNVVNIHLLKKQDTANTTVGILIAMALSDSTKMVFYFLFMINMLEWLDDSIVRSYVYCIWLLIDSTALLALTAFSNFLAVLLAFYRYVYMCRTNQIVYWSGRLRYCIIGLFFVSVLFQLILIPYYRINEISESVDNATIVKHGKLERNFTNESPLSRPQFPRKTVYAIGMNQDLDKFIMPLQAVVLKILPCVSMLFLMYRTRSILQQTTERRLQMIRAGTLRGGSTMYKTVSNMLLVVLAVFLITELPTGVATLVAGVNELVKKYYFALGDVWDLLTLINNVVNFPIYCVMSQQFRKALIETFFCQNHPNNQLGQTQRAERNTFLASKLLESSANVEVTCPSVKQVNTKLNNANGLQSAQPLIVSETEVIVENSVVESYLN